MTLYEECLEALGNNKEVLTISDTRKYHEQLGKSFPDEDIDEWLIENKIDDKTVILLWAYGDYPAVKTSLDNALNVIDDVTAVGSYTFMFSESGYVIEFSHDGDVTIGKAI
ncbi:hypothetical protein ACHADS_01450 [Bacillus vallismortis]|uniref:CDI toxin immunity protein n=1 Tax=Bacillus vallismortis TaxID=72361 RepID=UPI00374CCCB0